jgi:hypothetical protein
MLSKAPGQPADGEPSHLDIAPDALSVYWVQNVAIMVWHKGPSALLIDALHQSAAPRRARYPSGMSFVHLGHVQLSMLDGPTREAFVRVLRELEGYAASTAIVTRASGFWASTLRSVATGIVVLARSQVELRFHERSEELLSWLPARHEAVTGIKLDVEHLRRTLLRAEAELEPAASALHG